MSTPVTKTPQARRDLIELAEFIAEDSLDAAERFLHAAEQTFEILASSPQLGGVCHFRDPQAVGIRVWPRPDAARCY